MNRTTRAATVGATVAVLAVSVFSANAAFSDRSSIGEETTAGSVLISAGDTSSLLSNDTPLGSAGSITTRTTYTNDGSLPGHPSFQGSPVIDHENGRVRPEIEAGDRTPNIGELSSWAIFSVVGTAGTCEEDGAFVGGGDADFMVDHYADLDIAFDIVLQPGESICVETGFYVINAPNEAQTDSVEYTRNVTLSETGTAS